MGASAITGGLGVGLSAYQAIKAGNDKKSAQRALNGLATPELVNAFKNQQVSTLGADLRKTEAGRNTASAIDAARSGGARTIIGSLGQIQDNNNKVNSEIGANLDEQQKAIDANKAQDDVNIRNTKEQRYNNDVSALSSQINSANDGIQQGIGNAINGATTVGSELGAKSKLAKDSATKYKSFFSSSDRNVPQNIGFVQKKY